MLSPDSRSVAFELLRPPVGYEIDFALLTTYTLDLEALLALPLSIVSRAEKGIEELLADPLLLHQAIREAGQRIHVFVDRTGIAIPRARREMYAMLECSVHPVSAPRGGVFHPKVWLARFAAEGSEPVLRIAILSRNLTFDRSWDIALASEASPGQRRGATSSRPLAQFIRGLPELAVERLHHDVAEQITGLADEVARTAFPAPEGFSDSPIAFYVLGQRRRRDPWRPDIAGSRILAVAPFVNATGLKSVARAAYAERILVSAQDDLDMIEEDALSEWEPICTLSDIALEEPEDGAADRPAGLHAKMLAVEHGYDVTWYVGSANLTRAALTGKNVEVMAAVTARKGRRGGSSGFGIDRFLESGFDKLCMPYRRCEPESLDREKVDALKLLDNAREDLLNANLKVVCSAAEQHWKWCLQGRVSVSSPKVAVTIWPISVGEDRAIPLALPQTWNLPIQRLTGLAAFRLRVTDIQVDDVSLVLKLPVDGMPADRMHHVLMSLISDRHRFLAFLRAFLGGLEGMVDWARGDTEQDGSAAWGIGSSNETLLEDLVRAASRDPARLDPVRRLIDDFRKTEEGRRIVPDDFMCVWNAVEQVIRGDSKP